MRYLSRRWASRLLCGALAGLLGSTGMILIGHLCHLPLLYTWGWEAVEGMPLNSALLFLLNGLIVLCLMRLTNGEP